MEFGLNQSDIDYILNIIKGFSEIDKVVIFGSRAKGNYSVGSDVDLAIYGEGVNFDTLSKLHWKLENEGPLPYFFDVVDYTHLTHEELRKHIDRRGILIYDRFS